MLQYAYHKNPANLSDYTDYTPSPTFPWHLAIAVPSTWQRSTQKGRKSWWHVPHPAEWGSQDSLLAAEWKVRLRLLRSLAQFAVQNVCKRGFSFDQGMGQINCAPRNTGWILFLHWKIKTIWAPRGTTIPGNLVLNPYPGLAGV